RDGRGGAGGRRRACPYRAGDWGMRSTRLLVTLDVERDYRAHWRARELWCASVCEAIPERLHPLLTAHGVRPTYLLGGEILLDPACVAAVAALADCELG